MKVINDGCEIWRVPFHLPVLSILISENVDPSGLKIIAQVDYFCQLTQQAPADKWSLVSRMVPVRPSGNKNTLTR